MPEEARRPAKPYDATLKHLVESHPAEWLAYLGLPLGTRIGAVDADLSSVTAAADKVPKVDGPEPYIAHLEFQSGVDPDGAWNMSWEENSVTYQAILAEGEARGEAKGEAKGEIAGRIREAKALLLRLGTRRFQSPSLAISDEIQRIDDLQRLEALIERTIDASSWEQLLAAVK